MNWDDGGEFWKWNLSHTSHEERDDKIIILNKIIKPNILTPLH